MKRWQSLLLGVIISVITLAIALNGTNLSQLGDVLKTGQYIFTLLALFLVLIGMLTRAERWRLLLNNNIETRHSFNILSTSYLLSVILPFRLSEVVRAFMTTRLKPPVPILTSLTSIVAEKLLDLLSMVALVGIAITIAPVSPEIAAAARATGITAIVGIGLLIAIAARRSLAHRLLDQVLRLFPFLARFNVRDLADRAIDGIAPLASGRSLGLALFWTGISWAIAVIEGFILLYVFYPQASWYAALLIVAISSLAVALPAVPSSVGPFEFAITTALKLSGGIYSADPTRALAFAVMLHVVQTVSYLLYGLFGLSQEKISIGEILNGARQLASNSRRSNAEQV